MSRATVEEIRTSIERFRTHLPNDPDARDIITKLCDKAEKCIIEHGERMTCLVCQPYDDCRDIRWVRAIFREKKDAA